MEQRDLYVGLGFIALGFLILSWVLSSCAAQSSPTYIHVCPTIPQYSAAFEKQAAVELAALPPNDPLVKLVQDYIAVRAEAKACH